HRGQRAFADGPRAAAPPAHAAGRVPRGLAVAPRERPDRRPLATRERGAPDLGTRGISPPVRSAPVSPPCHHPPPRRLACLPGPPPNTPWLPPVCTHGFPLAGDPPSPVCDGSVRSIYARSCTPRRPQVEERGRQGAGAHRLQLRAPGRQPCPR